MSEGADAVQRLLEERTRPSADDPRVRAYADILAARPEQLTAVTKAVERWTATGDAGLAVMGKYTNLHVIARERPFWPAAWPSRSGQPIRNAGRWLAGRLVPRTPDPDVDLILEVAARELLHGALRDAHLEALYKRIGRTPPR